MHRRTPRTPLVPRLLGLRRSGGRPRPGRLALGSLLTAALTMIVLAVPVVSGVGTQTASEVVGTSTTSSSSAASGTEPPPAPGADTSPC